jgi:aminopeptidase N
MSEFPILAALVLPLWVLPPEADGRRMPGDGPPATSKDEARYVPDRDYDLRHVAVDLVIDGERRSFRGSVVNTLATLRDGVATIRLDCGANLAVTTCEVDGRQAAFRHDGDRLEIEAPKPLPPGEPVAVAVRYVDRGEELPNFRWIRPTPADPSRVGFWTKGQPYFNRQWFPTWDYPNDLTTSEVRVTVPVEWFVVGNGVLKSNVPSADGKARTFHWSLGQPHATYLISLVGGPFDVRTAEWRGVELLYVVPKGAGGRIEDTFGDTPEMLSFFSDTLGVAYPWPKYAQTAAHDFLGGMENVSATTIPAGDLADPRGGYKAGARGLAHELAHQWFGDLVTCKHWGEIWLNEGFADLMSEVYLEHARGKAYYDRAVAGLMSAYIKDSGRLKRPLATRAYVDAATVFDSHAYSKGAAVLHTLRRRLGDGAFFGGLRHYLTRHRHRPVDSHNLCSALTEASGIDLGRFFDQWVFSPGHPVLDYEWRWDEAAKQIVLTVRQTQDTSDGTPIYVIDATVGLVGPGGMARVETRLDGVDQQIRLRAESKPDAVLLDPDHDFLREIPTLRWSAGELPSILRYGASAVDRQEAMNRMLGGTPSGAAVRSVVEAVRADGARFPVFRDIGRLGDLRREDLRPLFREQLAHPDDERRAQAIGALGRLAKDDDDVKALRGLVSAREPYAVVRAAIAALGAWEAAANRDVISEATKQSSPFDGVRLVALDELTKADAAEGKATPDPAPELTRAVMRFLSDRARGAADSPVMTARQRARSASDAKGNREIAGVLEGLRSAVPLACDEVAGRGLEADGEMISRIAIYKFDVDGQRYYVKFFMTADGKVASFRPQHPSFR